jgi:hypothetical protein
VGKTTVCLPDDMKRRLALAARRRGESQARFLDGEARPRPTVPLFHGADPALAEHADEALAGFGT